MLLVNRIKLKEWSIGKDNIEINLQHGFTGEIPGITTDNEISIKEQLTYKYLISMDGNGTSWNGLIWKLYSNSLVIKEKTDCIEYWYNLLNDTNIIEFENFDEILDILNYENKEMLKEQKEILIIILLIYYLNKLK